MPKRRRLRSELLRCSFSVFAVAAACGGPSVTRQITGRSGRVYEAYAINHVYGRVPGFRDTTASRYLIVSYYTAEEDATRLDSEAEDVLAGSIPFVSSDETMIVIQQAKPVVARASGLVRGSMVRFVRDSSGSWQRDE